MLTSGQTITTSTFLKALKILNPKLRVCSYENSNRLAGLYLLTKMGNEVEDICGVDKLMVPSYATFDNGGHVIKSGWRRVFWILLGNEYTTYRQIVRVCPGFFDSKARAADRFVGGVSGDPIDNKLMKYAMENSEDGLSNDQVLDLAADIKAKDTVAQREEREHDKWFLEKWKENGGGVKDRPQY